MIYMENQISIFGTDGIRGEVGSEKIHPHFIMKLGWSLGKVLIDEGFNSHVVIGKDTRISGYMLESALEAGLSCAGIDIQLLGPMPTPAIAYLTKTFRASAGIVISASHNPSCDNGIKFFNNNGIKFTPEFEKLIDEKMKLPMDVVPHHYMGKAYRITDAPGRYIEFCKGIIAYDINLNSFKIVLDCANGANYHIAPSVFSELGADLIVINNSPDGRNINQNCGSTSTQGLQESVLNNKADIGISFDGDGDRVIMVDSLGRIVDGDDILLIITKYLHSIGKLKGGVVGTLMTNMGIEKSLNEMGIEFIRAKVGDKNIMKELKSRNWLLGGEESGHIINFKYNQTGDGIVAALQVLASMEHFNKSLSELRDSSKKYPKIIENVPSKNARDILTKPDVKNTINDIQLRHKSRVRIVIRPSGTEPLIRVLVEGMHEKYLQQPFDEIKKVIVGNV